MVSAILTRGLFHKCLAIKRIYVLICRTTIGWRLLCRFVREGFSPKFEEKISSALLEVNGGYLRFALSFSVTVFGALIISLVSQESPIIGGEDKY